MGFLLNTVMHICVSYKAERFLIRILVPGFGNMSIKRLCS
jgi:hypothetical protein